MNQHWIKWIWNAEGTVKLQNAKKIYIYRVLNKIGNLLRAFFLFFSLSDRSASRAKWQFRSKSNDINLYTKSCICNNFYIHYKKWNFNHLFFLKKGCIWFLNYFEREKERANICLFKFVYFNLTFCNVRFFQKIMFHHVYFAWKSENKYSHALNFVYFS